MADGARTRRTGMREVARAAGVSVSTVANVLSRPSIVAPDTRRRVEHAIDGVGYVPSGPARQLRGLPSPIVGSITLDLANPFYAELNRGIEDRLAEAGCLILACSTDLRAAKEKQLLNLLQAQAVVHPWNAVVTSSGSDVTARNMSYNGNLGAGASTTFGFTGSWNGSNSVPTLSCT